MGREEPQLGEAGELLAVDLLRRSFLNVDRTQSGSSFDCVCAELRASSQSGLIYGDPTVNFLFQVKTTQGGNRFEVPRSTFRSWLSRFEFQPVTLIVVKPEKIGRQSFWYLTFKDWLSSPRGRAALTSRKDAVAFKITDEFERCRLDGTNFHSKMIEEADRASGSLRSPWATLRDYRLFPFDEGMFFEFLELVRFAETPVEVSKWMASSGSSARSQLRRLLDREVSEASVVSGWISDIADAHRKFGAPGNQRDQFKLFVRVLKNYEGGIRLPPMKVSEVSAWRSFVAMYPYSRKMLDHVVRFSRHENDLMFASALLPILALSNNATVSADAHDTLRKLKDRRNDFSSYAFQREMYRGSAEAGNREDLHAGIDFMFRRSAEPFELRFLKRYGWTDEEMSGNLNRKLTRPTLRDQELRPWYEYLAAELL